MKVETGKGYVAKDEVLEALRVTLDDTVEAIRGIKNPDASAIGTWSARDVAVHLGDAFEWHQGVAEGKGAAVDHTDQIATVNQELINATVERDVNALADRLAHISKPYLEYLAGIEGDPVVPWAQLQVPLSAVIGLDIAECLVHGYDITHVEGRPWAIDDYRAALALKAISPITKEYADPNTTAGLKACFDLRLRGQYGLHFIFNDGTLRIEEPSPEVKPDVHISANPAAFMLVGYGRMSHWGPIFKGQITAWGRKPWLALRFSSLLKNP